MTWPVEFHPEAISEAREANSWYSDKNPAAAEAFMAELDKAVSKISTAPESWPEFLPGLRRILFTSVSNF